jgi:hypothetical protein
MEMHIVITDTEMGATISLLHEGLRWFKAYTSWEQALDEALRLNLMSRDTHREAQALPPVFSYCGNAQVIDQQLAAGGFTYHQNLAA